MPRKKSELTGARLWISADTKALLEMNARNLGLDAENLALVVNVLAAKALSGTVSTPHQVQSQGDITEGSKPSVPSENLDPVDDSEDALDLDFDFEA